MQKRYLFTLLLTTLLGMLLSSCKHQEDDVLPETDVFVSIMGAGSVNNTLTLPLRSTDPPSKKSLKIAIELTKPSARDIRAILELDTTLVQSYKATYNLPHYATLPTTAYKLTYPAGGFTIKAGSNHSLDSLQLDITDLSPLELANYILPIRIKSIDGNPDAVLSPLVSTVYVRILLLDNREVSLSLTAPAELVLPNVDPSSSDDLERNIDVRANLPVVTDTRCEVAVNNALLQAYNAANSVSYKQLPAAAYRITGSSLTIKAGTTSSTESLRIEIIDPSLLDKKSDYLLPIQLLSAVPSRNITLSPATTQYLHIYTDLTNIATSGVLEEANINRINPAWTATASSFLEYPGLDLKPQNVLDNDADTHWISDYNLPGAHLQIDMGTTHTLKGIRMGRAIIEASDFTPEQIEISTSQDGTNWEKQGKYFPDYDVTDDLSILFVVPVAARYFKLGWDDGYGGFSEVNAVE